MGGEGTGWCGSGEASLGREKGLWALGTGFVALTPETSESC